MSDIDVRLAQMAAQLDQEHARTADLRRDLERLAGERRKMIDTLLAEVRRLRWENGELRAEVERLKAKYGGGSQ